MPSLQRPSITQSRTGCWEPDERTTRRFNTEGLFGIDDRDEVADAELPDKVGHVHEAGHIDGRVCSGVLGLARRWFGPTLAERQGFEPWVPVRTHLISSQAHSTSSGTSPRSNGSGNRVRQCAVGCSQAPDCHRAAVRFLFSVEGFLLPRPLRGAVEEDQMRFRGGQPCRGWRAICRRGSRRQL